MATRAGADPRAYPHGWHPEPPRTRLGTPVPRRSGGDPSGLFIKGFRQKWRKEVPEDPSGHPCDQKGGGPLPGRATELPRTLGATPVGPRSGGDPSEPPRTTRAIPMALGAGGDVT